MKVVVNGLMTEYLRLGKSGAPLVLMLPGWKAPMDFTKILGEKTRDFDVLAVEFPGFDKSETPPRVWSVQDYTNFVEEFVKKVGSGKIYAIIGHSFGGRIMLNGCSSGQLTAEKLVFIDSAGVKPKTSTRGKVLRAIAGPARILPKNLRMKASRQFGSDDYNNTSGVMRETFKQIVNLDLTDKMRQIKQPSLLIWGADDHDTPISDAEIFAREIPQAKLEIVENAGHYVFLDQPEKVRKIIGDFL